MGVIHDVTGASTRAFDLKIDSNPLTGVSSYLMIDVDPMVASLLSDLPFVGLASIGFAMMVFMLLTLTITKTSAALIVSVSSAFLAAVMDIADVIVMSNSSSLSSVIPLIVTREVFLALSITAKFVYIWRLSGESVATLMLDEDGSQASWRQWGVSGLLASTAILLMIAGIGITQLIWRIGLIFSMKNWFTVYELCAVLEIVATVCLTSKLLGNIWLSPPFRPSKAAKMYFPLIFATVVGLSVPVGNLLTFLFSETAYGRFLESIQLYIYALFTLFVTLFNVYRSGAGKPQSFRSATVRPTSVATVASFHNRSRPPSIERYNYPSPAPLLETMPASYVRPNTRRRSTAERLNEWVSERIVVRPEGDVRMSSDLERGTQVQPLKAPKAKRGFLVEGLRQLDRPGSVTSAEAFANEVRSQSSKRKRKGSMSSMGVVEIRAKPPSPLASVPSSAELDSPDVRIQVEPVPFLRDSAVAGPKTPISADGGTMSPTSAYGDVDPLGERRFGATSTTTSMDLDALLREQDERDKTVAKLLGMRESSTSRSAFSMQSNSHKSVVSDFTLSNFPSPPAVSSTPRPAFPKPLLLSSSNGSTTQTPEVVVDDVRFTLAPPNWRRSHRALTDNTGSLGSNSAIVINKADYKPSAQWDITSFIGGVQSPMGPDSPRAASTRDSRQDETLIRYPSAVASSTTLPSAFSMAETEEIPQIMEVQRRVSIGRLVPQRVDRISVPVERVILPVPRADSSEDSIIDPEVSPLRSRAADAVSAPTSSGPAAAESKRFGTPTIDGAPRSGSPSRPMGPGRTSPFPLRPVDGSGTGRGSGQSPTTSPQRTNPQTTYDRPRRAPSPFNALQATGESKATPRGMSPPGYI